MFNKTVAKSESDEVTIVCKQFMGSAPEKLKGKFELSALYLSDFNDCAYGVGKSGMTKAQIISLRDNLNSIIDQI